ncbi:MAG: hypothetical protein FJX73_03145 [Armatimonadetes bacterium]|nr:hypothetical protein [Armatimonadota bacterium]
MPRRDHGIPANERGATLTELLAVVAMLTLVIVALVPLLWTGQQTWNRVDRHTEVTQNARRALDKIVREVRAAGSFQVVGDSLIRLTMASGDGTGATPTVEYQLNAGTGNLEYRQSGEYFFRRRITVTAGTAVPAGYSVPVVFDHAALVAAGKSLASGNDVRVRYRAGTRWVELDRFRDIPTAWNSTTTRVWFRLQAPIAAGGSDGDYYLFYGDLSAGTPPSNGVHVFLDYEDGTSLAGWTRRDGCAGTHSASADGFVFTASSGSCHRQFSKNVPHSDADGHQTGVSARRSDTGVGYIVTLADETNATLRIRYWTVWSTTGGAIGSVSASVTPGTNYYGRFYLVGSALKVKYWAVGAAEPGWRLEVTHSTVASGAHYGQVDGYTSPQDHRHRNIIVRRRVSSEPATALAAEEAAPVPAAWQPLAGPFRAMSVQCFNAAGSAVACPAAPGPSAEAVRSVQVALTAMDPTGEVADIVVTSSAYRQAP